MELDVHNHSLEEAIEEILYKFDECKECRDNSLQIIHGYKHGTVIKDYIRSSGFLLEMAKNGNEIIESSFSQEGVTIFKIKLPINSTKKKPMLKSSSNEQKEETSPSLKICYKCKEPMTFLKEFNWYKCFKCGNLRTG